MYCKHCGKQNCDRDFYCVHCGEAINPQTSTFKLSGLKEDKLSFCKKCGTALDSRFCTNCGEAAYKLTIEPDSDINLKTMKDKAQTPIADQYNSIRTGDLSGARDIMGDKSLLLSSAAAAAKIFIIGLILSFLLFSAVRQIDRVSELYDNMDTLRSEEGMQKLNILPNVPDVYGFSLQIPSSFSAGGSYMGQDLGKAELSLSVHILILLLIPFIAVWLALLKSFKGSGSTLESMPQYIASSAIFSIGMNIILLFNGKSLIGESGGISLKASGHFNFLSGCISVFLIILCMELLLSALYKKESISGTVTNGFFNENLRAAGVYVKNMTMYTLFYIAVAVIAILFANGDAGEKLAAILVFIAALPNLLVNTWLLLLGGKFGITAPDASQVHFSLMDAWKGASDIAKYSNDATTSLLPFGILLILIAVAVIYILIEAARKLSKEQYFARLGIFAATAAFINMLLALVISFTIRVSGSSELLQQFNLPYLSGAASVFVGFPAVQIFILSFIALCAAGIAAYATKSISVLSGIFSFLEQKAVLIKLSYLVVTLVFMYIARNNALQYLEGLKYLLQDSLDIL